MGHKGPLNILFIALLVSHPSPIIVVIFRGRGLFSINLDRLYGLLCEVNLSTLYVVIIILVVRFLGLRHHFRVVYSRSEYRLASLCIRRCRHKSVILW